MSTEDFKRKLTAIFSADVEGFEIQPMPVFAWTSWFFLHPFWGWRIKGCVLSDLADDTFHLIDYRQ